jgi:formamidopyrimidine-DNA glycosylase
MPELPEVETVRRGLEPVMVGQRFLTVEQRRPNLRFPLPERFPERLTGQRVETLGRRAKYLLAGLSGGDVLVMHLGMSGRFTCSGLEPSSDAAPMLGEFVHPTGADTTHDHIVFTMESGAVVTYNDPRRFGFMVLIPAAELDDHKLFSGMGVEPLGNAFHAGVLATRAAGRSVDLKALLLDQRNVAGLGNIYVCEALHRSGLSPTRKAASLADAKGRPTERAQRLVPVIRQVLEEAIVAGGSTLRDFAKADGTLGYFQHRFQVYDREGEPCLKAACAGVVQRIVQSGRSTFFCKTCQR